MQIHNVIWKIESKKLFSPVSFSHLGDVVIKKKHVSDLHWYFTVSC